MAVQNVDSALQEFLQVQTCRAQLYTRFHEGFKAFLRTKQEGQYKILMAELTASFSDCSRKVIALEGALKEMGRADLAATLRSVQETEREKLRLTLTLQALKQAAAFRTFSWQQQQKKKTGGAEGDDAGALVDDDEALALLDPHFAAVARGGCMHGHGHGHGHDHGHGHGHDHSHSHVDARGNGIGNNEADSSAATAATAAGDDCGSDTARVAGAGGPCSRASCAAQANGGSQAGGNSGATRGGDSIGGCGDCGSGGNESANGGDAGSGGAAPAAAPEPTRREFEAAVKEAMQGLDACILRINEAIGDVRMELEES